MQERNFLGNLSLLTEKNDILNKVLSILVHIYYKKINITKNYMKYIQKIYNKIFTIGDYADILI